MAQTPYRTVPERLTALEVRAFIIDERTRDTDGKVDLLVDWMTSQQAGQAARDEATKHTNARLGTIAGVTRGTLALVISGAAVLIAAAK